MKFRFTSLSDVGLVRSASKMLYYSDRGAEFLMEVMGGQGRKEASRATQEIQANQWSIEIQINLLHLCYWMLSGSRQNGVIITKISKSIPNALWVQRLSR